MKYTFKPQTNMKPELVTNPEQDTTGTGRERFTSREHIRNHLTLYMRSRVIDAVEAVGNLLEFRHVKIEPNVE